MSKALEELRKEILLQYLKALEEAVDNDESGFLVVNEETAKLFNEMPDNEAFPGLILAGNLKNEPTTQVYRELLKTLGVDFNNLCKKYNFDVIAEENGSIIDLCWLCDGCGDIEEELSENPVPEDEGHYTLSGSQLYEHYFYKHVVGYIEPLLETAKSDNTDMSEWAQNQIYEIIEFLTKMVANQNIEVVNLKDINDIFICLANTLGFSDLSREEQIKAIDEASKLFGHTNGIEWLEDSLLKFLNASDNLERIELEDK